MTGTWPADFVFGVSDSDLQVIGEENTLKAEGSEPSMWAHFAQNSGKCHNNQGPAEGIDRYHRWREDIALMKSMGVKNYRTSISMARFLSSSGEVNLKAATWYEEYFRELKRAGINVLATLYHWELPQFLSEKGGWRNRLMVDWLSKHADAVYQVLGEYISEYFILNEPWCSSFLSYLLGVHAPGQADMGAAVEAAHNLLLAQGAAFERLKSLDRTLKVSTALNLHPVYPADLSEKSQLAAQYADGFYNTWFLDAMFRGRYPQPNSALYSKFGARASREDMALIQIGPRLHSLGVNYYHGVIVEHDDQAHSNFVRTDRGGGSTNALGWPIFTPPVYPEGLYDILAQVYFGYRDCGLKRLLITENGIALNTPWDGSSRQIEDSQRIVFIEAHLAQVQRALARGIPVKGYLHWTLADNYEWAEGYQEKAAFGLVHVDRASMKRIPKMSAAWYSENCLRPIAGMAARPRETIVVPPQPVVSAPAPLPPVLVPVVPPVVTTTIITPTAVVQELKSKGKKKRPQKVSKGTKGKAFKGKIVRRRGR